MPPLSASRLSSPLLGITAVAAILLPLLGWLLLDEPFRERRYHSDASLETRGSWPEMRAGFYVRSYQPPSQQEQKRQTGQSKPEARG